MELKGNGVDVSVNPAEQSDEWILDAAQEIADVARERGLELPNAVGTLAAEGAMRWEESDTKAEVSPADVQEAILTQLPIAASGNRNLTNDLNDNLPRKAKKFEIVEHGQVVSEFLAWFTDEKLAQVVARQEANPKARFTLIATPNVLVPKDTFKAAAKAFGDDQPYETYIYDPLYDKYTGGELSGTDPNNGKAVKFGLVESTFAPELEGTVPEQRAKLLELQAKYPDVDVPSPLEAVSYWYALRAQDPQLKGNEAFDLTYIRHFNEDEKRIDGGSCVPDSFVRSGGRAVLDSSLVRNDGRGRVLVG